MKFTLIVLLATTFAAHTWGCSEDGKSGFLPKNDLYIPVGFKSMNGGLDQNQFNAAISRVQSLYTSEVASMGAKLVIDRQWEDGEVNAFASREGNTWKVTMTGGLARHETITSDGLSLVVCHEIGHHIGGAPKKKMGWNPWSSTEGQADYFAALKCLRRVFLNDDNAKIVKTMKAPAALKRACLKSHGKIEKDLCVRIGMAGLSVAHLFQSLSGESAPSFTTPDQAVVASTFERHPATQCRLDTFFQGALCEKSMNEEVSQSDEVKGTCHASLGDKVGVRPACWFKTKL